MEKRIFIKQIIGGNMKTTSIFITLTFLLLIGTNIIGQEISKLVLDKIKPFKTMQGSAADIVQVLPGERIIEKSSLEGKTVLFCTEKNGNQTKNADFSYTLNNIIAITPPNGYSSPKWSPDGNKLLFTTNKYAGLYIINLNGKKEIIKLNMLDGAGYNAEWSEDSKNIFYRHKITDAHYKSLLEVKSINILTREINNQPNINPDGIASSCNAKADSDIVVYTNTRTLLIEAQTFDKSKNWIVTNNPGQYFKHILSPDKTKVVLHTRNDMFVYASDGSGLISSLGDGIANSWSSDSKQILFFISEDDGHKYTGSEIYLCNSDGSQRWQLTNTPNVFEMYPSWSPDNKKIAFSDGKTGTIYTANLIKTKRLLK